MGITYQEADRPTLTDQMVRDAVRFLTNSGYLKPEFDHVNYAQLNLMVRELLGRVLQVGH